MPFETKEDPEHVMMFVGNCQSCRINPCEFKQEWRLGSRPSRRNNEWGILHEWMYRCFTCKELEEVRYWQATPTEPMFTDSDFEGMGND